MNEIDDKARDMDWQQQRPAWCPHQTCGFAFRSQDAICIGRLPVASLHDGTPNTHRLCQRGAPDDGLWLHSVEWNRGDAWNLWRGLNAVFGFDASLRRENEAFRKALERARQLADDERSLTLRRQYGPSV